VNTVRLFNRKRSDSKNNCFILNGLEISVNAVAHRLLFSGSCFHFWPSFLFYN